MAEYVRWQDGGAARWGLVQGEELLDLGSAPWDSREPTGRRLRLADQTLLAPVSPSKVIGVGWNYRAHAAEMAEPVPQEPVIFLKAPSALLDPEGIILRPTLSRQVDFEGELALVIGARARHVTEREAADYIFGYTIANDVTARDLQRREGRMSRAKSFDTFLPVGPRLVTEVDHHHLRITTKVNGELHQDESTDQLIFPPEQLVAYISRIMTLLPGDLILTGTPNGIGPLQPGDVVEIDITGLGRLRNKVSDSL